MPTISPIVAGIKELIPEWLAAQWFWWEACYTGWMRDDLLITGLSICRTKNLTFYLSGMTNVYISVLSLVIGCSGFNTSVFYIYMVICTGRSHTPLKCTCVKNDSILSTYYPYYYRVLRHAAQGGSVISYWPALISCRLKKHCNTICHNWGGLKKQQTLCLYI